VELIYQILEQLIPFDWIQYTFMKNALLAVLLIAPSFAVLSTLIVNNRMAFFSDSLGHSILTGIAIGSLLGLGNPVWAMLLFGIFFSIMFYVIKTYAKISIDTVIGVLSSLFVSLGVVILSMGGNFKKYAIYLIGDLLSITPTEILMLLILLIVIAGFWIFFFNRILFYSIAPSIAQSRGWKQKLNEVVFSCLIAIIIIVSIRWVGILIINSLLILPAATARNFSRNIKSYHIFSIVMSSFSCLTGLILSYYLDTSTGATIALICSVIFLLSLLKKQ
jgi:zinc transport system permease protein